MKKQTICLLLVVVMLVSIMPITTQAAATPNIYVDTSALGELKAGDEISVPVSVQNNPGLCIAYLEFEFPSVLTYVSCTDNTGANTCTYANNIVVWEYDADFEKEYAEDGPLFTLTFTVNENASAGDYEIKVGLKGGVSANLGNATDDVTATFTSGTITIAADTSGVKLVNGGQNLTFDEAKAEALGAEGAVTLTSPGDGYLFAGWFTGLTADGTNLTMNDAGQYILSGLANPSYTFTGTELRPRYDTAPEGGTYNALWIQDSTSADGYQSFVMVVGDSTFTVYQASGATPDDHAAQDANLLNTAVVAAEGKARVKLVKDMTTDAQIITKTTVNNNTVYYSMHLDMNGCTLANTSTSQIDVLMLTQTGDVIDSGRLGGKIANEYIPTSNTPNYAIYISGQADVIRDVTLESCGTAVYCYGGAVSLFQNCELIRDNTTNYQTEVPVISMYGSIGKIDGCTITSTGALIKVAVSASNKVVSIGEITNTTMTTTSDMDGVIWGTCVNDTSSARITFGSGNTVKAENASSMFAAQKYIDSDSYSLVDLQVEFTSTDGTYQVASTGAVISDTADATPPVGYAFLDEGGVLSFDDAWVVSYYSCDGSELLYTENVVKGGAADLSDHVVDYGITGEQYDVHTGWSLTQGGEAVTELTVTENVSVYALKESKNAGASLTVTPIGNSQGVTTYYETLDDAVIYIAANYIWQSNYNIELDLLADASAYFGFGTYVDEATQGGRIYIGMMPFTVDLNGHKLTFTPPLGWECITYVIDGSADFVITSTGSQGTIVVSDGAWNFIGGYPFADGQNITIRNVKIESSYLKNYVLFQATVGGTTTLTLDNVEATAAGNIVALWSEGGTGTFNLNLINCNLASTDGTVAQVWSGADVSNCTINVNISGENTKLKSWDSTYPINSMINSENVTVTGADTIADIDGDGWYTLHTHDYGTEWESDETNHWHECACGAKSDEANHADGDDANHTCDTCGAENVSEHDYVGGSCTICGEEDPDYIPPITTADIFTDKTGTTTPATITAPTNGWVVGEENTFTVTCEKACVVAVVNADGTYTRLTATEADTGYTFTTTINADTKIVVAIKGDVNGDGEADTTDCVALKAASLGYSELNAMQTVIAEINGDGTVDTFDRVKLKAALLGNATIEW